MQKYSKCEDMESLSISLYSEAEDLHLQTLLAKNKQKNKHQHVNSSNKKKTMLISEARMMTTWFLILSIVIVGVMLFKYLPSCNEEPRMKTITYFTFSKSKLAFRSFSEYYYELDPTIKILLILSQIILSFIVYSYTALKRQEDAMNTMNLPYMELTFYLANTICLLSVGCLIALTVIPTYSDAISLKMSLADNFLFTLFVIFSITMTFLISKMSQTNRTIFFLFTALPGILYMMSLVFVSYYMPLSKTDEFFYFLLGLCLNVNSVLFPLTLAVFIFSLKADLTTLGLNMKDYNDYFGDMEEDCKNVL